MGLGVTFWQPLGMGVHSLDTKPVCLQGCLFCLCDPGGAEPLVALSVCPLACKMEINIITTAQQCYDSVILLLVHGCSRWYPGPQGPSAHHHSPSTVIP